MFCKNCGTKLGNEKVCPNCGYNESKDISIKAKQSEKAILITEDEAKKLTLAKMGISAIVLIMSIALLFLPIFRTQVQSIEDLITMDAKQFEQLLENGGEKDFSYYDEASLVFEQLMDEKSSVNLNDIFLSGLTPFLLLLVSLILLLGVGLFGVIKSAIAYFDIERTRIQYFTRAEKYPKDSILNLRSNIDVVIVILAILFDGFFSWGSDVVFRRIVSVGFWDFSNFNFFYVVVVALAVGLFVLKYFANRLDETVRKEINWRRREKKEQNKKENEAARQRNAEKKKAQTTGDQGQEDTLEAEQKTKEHSGANQSGSVIEELKQYKDLLDTGVITQEEFEAKKKQLMGL